jgi:hypothetical protein
MTDAYYELLIHDRAHEIVATMRFVPQQSIQLRFPHQLIEIGEVSVVYHPPKYDDPGLGPIIAVRDVP